MDKQRERASRQPNLRLLSASSLLIAAILAAESMLGLLNGHAVYRTDELFRSFAPNDAVNLLIGLPGLLVSVWLARRGELIGRLIWPGALLYVTYNSIAYAAAMPFTWMFLSNLALMVLSITTIAGLLTQMDGAATQKRLAGAVHERLAGGVLIALGALFFLRSAVQVAGVFSGTVIAGNPTVAVAVADLITTPLWVVAGIWLWRKQSLGYLNGAGLLFQASMLFLGLLLFLVLQPLLTHTRFSIPDFTVILAMSLFCFIPFGLLVRGVVSRSGSSSS